MAGRAARKAAERALALFEAEGHPRGIANAQRWLGRALVYLGEVDEGEALLERALVALRGFGFKREGGVLRDLAAEKKLAFLQSFIGKALEAITLNVAHDGPDGERTEALTDNYQKLHLKGRHEPNHWIRAHIERVEDGALAGMLA